MASGLIRQINIGEEMREAYLDYAMSVIVSRALPDARDGLKPVHRRILYAMYDMGLRSDTPHRKSARIVGEVLGKYHPHGDAAVYDAMVRLAQDFSMRNPLVDGQGNFGSIDGDGAAAMRYTEARITPIGEELLQDINKDTVLFGDNFDGSLLEPKVLPANIPNLLVNGASGIAVGMSTNIPPHNLSEVCDALVFVLDRWNDLESVTLEDLMGCIQGPDFPTGGLVYRHLDGLKNDNDTLVTAYATGRGKITVRAKVYLEDIGRGKSQVIITEIPYQVSKSSLIERIATLAREGRIEGIADLRDESDRQGLRLLIELQRGSDTNKILSDLFKLTPLQDTFSIQMLALVDGQPRMLNLKQALRVYLEHRQEVVRRRSEYDLLRAQQRAHILEGLLKALDQLDQAIAIIRGSDRVETARVNLIAALDVSEIQAQAILDMQLRRLAALERQSIIDEYQEKQTLIAYLTGLLADGAKMREVIAEELSVIKATYGEPRRTIIVDDHARAVVRAEDFLLPGEQVWLTFTTSGKLAVLRGEAPPRVTVDQKEPPLLVLQSNTNHTLYLFATDGQAATVPVQQIPQVNDPSEGTFFADLCAFNAEQVVIAAISLPAEAKTGYLFLTSEAGDVKRLRIDDMPGLTNKPFTVMNVGEGRVLSVLATSGVHEVILTTAQGQAIRFPENNVRPTGLPSGGMRGIKLQGEKDRVVDASVIDLAPQGELFVWNITDDGIAKISPLEDYPLQGRAGQGVITMRIPEKSKEVAAAAIGTANMPIIVLTDKHKAKTMRFDTAELVRRGRTGYGEPVIALRGQERVVAVMTHQPLFVLPDETDDRVPTEEP
ncbi:MAG: DNA gyrase/topoisomerase IV subunit A [Phototrophicaceae bacterium]|jgi:DNA gyrase subunit A